MMSRAVVGKGTRALFVCPYLSSDCEGRSNKGNICMGLKDTTHGGEEAFNNSYWHPVTLHVIQLPVDTPGDHSHFINAAFFITTSLESHMTHLVLGNEGPGARRKIRQSVGVRFGATGKVQASYEIDITPYTCRLLQPMGLRLRGVHIPNASGCNIFTAVVIRRKL